MQPPACTHAVTLAKPPSYSQNIPTHAPCSCRAAVTKLERIPAGTGLYISPLTLQAYRNEADLARHAQQLQGTLQTLMASGPTAGGTQQQQQQHMGWKPPPPPGAPPGSSAGGGYGRQPQQHQFGRQRQGPGNVMVPR